LQLYGGRGAVKRMKLGEPA